MRCPSCGGDTPDGKRFCADCGRPLGALCPSCGAEVLAGKPFCADCGTPIAARAASVLSPQPPTTPCCLLKAPVP